MNMIKKSAPRASANSSNNHDSRRFPPEAYEYQADVTKEGVEEIRRKAAPTIEAEEWELIDGFDGENSKVD